MMTIRTRLFLSIGGLAGMLLLVMAAGWVALKIDNRALEVMYDDYLVGERDLSAVVIDYTQQTDDAVQQLYNGTIEPETALADLAKARGDISAQWQDYLKTAAT